MKKPIFFALFILPVLALSQNPRPKNFSIQKVSGDTISANGNYYIDFTLLNAQDTVIIGLGESNANLNYYSDTISVQDQSVMNLGGKGNTQRYRIMVNNLTPATNYVYAEIRAIDRGNASQKTTYLWEN